MEKKTPKISYKDIAKTNPKEIRLIVCPLSIDTFNNKLEITKVIKNIYPESYIMAIRQIQNGKLRLGDLYCYQENLRTLAYIPIRQRFTDKIDVDPIKKGLEKLDKYLLRHPEIETIGIPQMAPWFTIDGAKWEELKPAIVQAVKEFPKEVKVTIFEKMP